MRSCYDFLIHTHLHRHTHPHTVALFLSNAFFELRKGLSFLTFRRIILHAFFSKLEFFCKIFAKNFSNFLLLIYEKYFDENLITARQTDCSAEAPSKYNDWARVKYQTSVTDWNYCGWRPNWSNGSVGRMQSFDWQILVAKINPFRRLSRWW